MKRFHVHIAVNDLTASIDFYSKLFGQSPTRQQPDYAKWMLEDPRVNFAVSSRGHAVGVNHFGIQADSIEELSALKKSAVTASGGVVLEQREAACCYANSQKHWTIDPQGLAWENFITLSDAPVFGDDTAGGNGACCIPLSASNDDASPARESCCIPTAPVQSQAQCCA